MTSSPSEKIILVGPVHPYRGGIAHFSNRLSQALAERYRVGLLNFSRQYPKLLFPGKTQTEDTPWELPTEPVRLLDSVNPATWVKSGQWLAEQRPDVVMLVHWLPFFVPAYLTMLWAMRRRLRHLGADDPEVVLFLHNVRPHNAFPLTEPLMRALIRASNRYFTLSPHVTNDLLEIAPGAQVLEGFHPTYDHYAPPIPPEEARQQLGLPERPTILFFGYIRDYKGLDVLIDALPKARERVDVQLVVAGEFYDNEEALRGHVERLGLGDAVRFFSSYIPNEEVHLYFSAAEVVGQPYKSATPSGVVQTAFYFGKPVIVTDLGVLREVVPDGEAGYVVPPEDPDALADAIARFFEGEPARLAEGARAQSQKFSWDALVDQLDAFLFDRTHA